MPLPVPPSLAHRISIHKLPARFNADVAHVSLKMRHGVYLHCEQIFHELLLHSKALVHAHDKDASQRARFIFVPLYVGLLSMGATDGRHVAREAELDAAFDALAAPPTLWPVRSRDHIFVATVDRAH